MNLEVLLKDIVQINAVLSFGAVTLDVKLTDFLFLLNLCIMIKFTLFPLQINWKKKKKNPQGKTIIHLKC